MSLKVPTQTILWYLLFLYLIPNESSFIVPIPQGQSASQNMPGKQASLAYWNISERKSPACINVYPFSSKALHFCPDFLWIREGVSELLCNALQKELIFRKSARLELFKHLKWPREVGGKEIVFGKVLWPWINLNIQVTLLGFLLYIHIFPYTHKYHTCTQFGVNKLWLFFANLIFFRVEPLREVSHRSCWSGLLPQAAMRGQNIQHLWKSHLWIWVPNFDCFFLNLTRTDLHKWLILLYPSDSNRMIHA